MGATAAGRNGRRGRRSKGSAKHLLSVKVDRDLRARIDAISDEMDQETSETVRMLLAFAVTEHDDPRTRVLYAVYNNVTMRCYRILQEGTKTTVAKLNTFILDGLNDLVDQAFDAE